MLISDDTHPGLGITQQFLHTFFGSLFLVARATPHSYTPSDFIQSFDMSGAAIPLPTVSQTFPPLSADIKAHDTRIPETEEGFWQSFESVLIASVPNPGYFVAGGLAGIVSRTSTAPLDRLKVYLIAQTSVATNEAVVTAAKSGNIVRVATNSWRPLAHATKELWKAGGIRNLYAGESTLSADKGPGLIAQQETG